MRTSIAVVSATRKMKDEDADEQDYSSPPAKIKRDAFSYVGSGKTALDAGCKSCYFFDKGESECELFEVMQSESPELFELDKKVGPNAGCKGHIARKKES